MYSQAINPVIKRMMMATISTVLVLAMAGLVVGMRFLHASRTASPSFAGPASAVADVAPASGSSLSACRIAVTFSLNTTKPAKVAGGFLSYQKGDAAADAGVLQTAISAGAPAWTFDVPLQRWVPARSSSVSPDGQAYAAVSDNGALTRVDAATGQSSELVHLGVIEVLGWANQGVVYLAQNGNTTDFMLANPNTGAATRLDVPAFPAFFKGGRVNGNALWGVGLSSGNVPSIVRFDLANGQASPWYNLANQPVGHHAMPQILGFDKGGYPVVLNAPSGFNGNYQVLDLNAAGQAISLFSGTPSSAFRPAQQVIGDANGIWMLGTDGSLWIHDGHALRSVALHSDHRVAGLAGGCRS